MCKDLIFSIKSIPFDEDYCPSSTTRLTTNFANLARGEDRQLNLRNTLTMINHRFNALAHWDNPHANRYTVRLEIISAELQINSDQTSDPIPLIEMLNATIEDHHANKTIPGIVGHSFSSYVRDYDFSIVLPEHHAQQQTRDIPEGFGVLHGQLFKHLIQSTAFKTRFPKQPVICLSASTSKTYQKTSNRHPILGEEYVQNAYSLTDEYFQKMGLSVRFFMPAHSVAPLAFYFSGDLLSDFSDLELISTISTMETFQRIYRPEIYNANTPAGSIYQPSLTHSDYSLTRIHYDREERSRLAQDQGRRIQETFITPYAPLLAQWSAHHAQ